MEEKTKPARAARLLWSTALGLGLAVGVLLACALRPGLGQAASPSGAAPSDVWVNKSAPVGNIVPGDEYRYVIDYGNEASNPATDVVITDILPDYVTYLRDTSGVTPTVDSDTRTLVWRLGRLGGQQSETFELWVKLDATVPQETQLRNLVGISDPDDQNPDNNWSHTDVWPDNPYVNLWVDESLKTERPIGGRVIIYYINYGNDGNRTAHNVVLADTLPLHTTFVRSDFETGADVLAERVDDGIVVWEIGALPSGESQQFELVVRIDEGMAPGTLLTNKVAIRGDEDQGECGDNRSWRATVLEPMAADLWVGEEVSSDLSSIEHEIIYRISYGNDGMLPAKDVILTCTLPVSMTYLRHSNKSAATLADGVIVWRLGQVPSASNGQLMMTMQVSGTVSAGAAFTNAVEASTSTPELDYDNNVAVTTLGPPRAICVPWAGDLPHRVWSRQTTTLKGTTKGYGLTTFEWDPGDGRPAIAGTVDDPYVIEGHHAYSAALGTVYTAMLTVRDAFGWSDTDTYVVQVFSPTHGIQVDAAVDEALWYIHKAAQRYEHGNLSFAEWGGDNRVAENASAVQAFQVQGHLPDGDPWEDPYVEDVQRGWNAIFTYAKPDTTTIQPAGNPDSDGDRIGIGIYSKDSAAIYESGLALMALASTSAPDRVARTGPSAYVRGQTYYSITQDMADWFAWGQNDAESGSARGGWRYQPNSCDSDNSNTQFPVLGLAAAEHNWGITVPTWVKNELRDHWLAYTQDSSSGGFGYQHPDHWINVGKTGAGIMDLTWTGVPATDARIARAAQFIAVHWNDAPDGNWNGNVGELYAMYAVKKGSQLAGIHQYGSHVWDNEYAAYLVSMQSPGGYFDAAGNISWQPMSTAWVVLILSPGLYQALPVPVIPPFLAGGPGPKWAEVEFDASDSYHTDPERTIAFYEWDFGDASPVVTATAPITVHTYPTRGTYLALLTVWDDVGNHATAASQVNITGPGYHPPVADPGGPYSGHVGQEITLDGSESSDPDAWMGDSVVLYEWNVAGSEFYTTSAPTLAYRGTVAGTFVVVLRVQDRGAGDGPDRPQWSAPATTTVTIIAPPEVKPTPTAVRPTPMAVEPTSTPAKGPSPEPRWVKWLVPALMVAILGTAVVLLVARAATRRRA